MEIIPLQTVPNQTVSVLLNNQNCQINVYQLATGLYLDLSADGVLIIAGVVCRNLNRAVIDAYLGFSGDLTFIDNQGLDDPVYTGLGGDTARFSLAYLSPADLAGVA